MNPKAFISYSWTSESHREIVRSWADRLISDGIEIILDQYDLKEGHDKYVFMEKMVTDPSVTHVLVICDKAYAEKQTHEKLALEQNHKSFLKKFTIKSNNQNSFQFGLNYRRQVSHIFRSL